jgi:hypothetical protein
VKYDPQAVEAALARMSWTPMPGIPGEIAEAYQGTVDKGAWHALVARGREGPPDGTVTDVGHFTVIRMTPDQALAALQRARHRDHGRGTEADGPEHSDCTCRGTDREPECAHTGCGFCRSKK